MPFRRRSACEGCEHEVAERGVALLDGGGIPDPEGADPRVRRARTRHPRLDTPCARNQGGPLRRSCGRRDAGDRDHGPPDSPALGPEGVVQMSRKKFFVVDAAEADRML